MAKIRAGNPDRTPSPVWQCDNDKSETASRAFRQNCKPLAEKRRPRIRDRGHAPQPFENCIILRCSVIPPTPTRSWIASFITPIASNSSARACAERAEKEPNPLDQKQSEVRQSPRSTNAAPGRDHLVKGERQLSRNPRAALSRCRQALSSESAKRNGTTTLFAALDILHGTVIGRCMTQHRHQEFIRFLAAVERAVPAGKVIHAILDNYATHKHPAVLKWLANHPRWTFHFTPTSASWLNAVEGIFSTITRRKIRRGAFEIRAPTRRRNRPLHQGTQ